MEGDILVQQENKSMCLGCIILDESMKEIGFSLEAL